LRPWTHSAASPGAGSSSSASRTWATPTARSRSTISRWPPTVEDLGDAHRALALHDLALAAYTAAAAHRLVEVTAEHARTRRQFGRAIGEFQAVAHPLADCAVRLGSAATLARAAAFEFDRGGTSETVVATAAAARLSASRAGLAAAHTCHQLFGAQGIALEGPVFRVSRRLRQLASQPPSVESCRQALLRRFGL
jgi:alkylation response protein AidB-like acyl-CoA dehydrogenase